jgi:membrane-anchored protein YejM (alkaline phosphatase superfamily)
VASQSYWPRWLRKPELNLTQAQARYGYFDTSFEVLRQLLSISHQTPCDDLCEYLKQQTNIPASVSVTPVEFNLTPQLKPASGTLPNIFIIVADSLRQDYVSAYNQRVDFTPNLGKFAEDSVVMRNAFTRYGGTTLAEPSIWTGSMLLHKHYIEPFYPLNSLEKMIRADGYHAYVSVDTVLRVLLSPQPDLVKLDEGLTNWSDLDLCSTAQELEQKLDARGDRSAPIFFFSQPQNVHGVAIGRHYRLRPPHRDYSPFATPYASEIERMDGCFGELISFLKKRQLYENSIIVFTADHGETLGEVGHHMHAFGMHPEILRVPLIIHLPPAMRRQYMTDTEQIAFSIDITPTIYYLLGHRPVANSEEAGKPLFASSASELAAYRRSDYLVASSYGPIYGILSDDARGFFVADELDGIYQYFDLSNDPVGLKNIITPELQAHYQPIMRRKVEHIAEANHFTYHAPTLLDWALR